MRITTLAGVLLCALLPGKDAMADATDLDIDAVGPRVGETAPDFTLRDQTGVERSRGSLMGPRGLVLVFFRSADW